MRKSLSRGLFLSVGVLPMCAANAGLLEGLMDPPPTAEECLCGGQSGWIGAPDAESCVREFKFPPVGGYTDNLDDELNLPTGITVWRPFVSTCWSQFHVGAAVTFMGNDTDPGWNCEGDCRPTWELRGFAPSLSLRIGVVQGDYLPITNDPVLSTSPLASAFGGFGEPRSPHTRAVLGNAVDLITGQPLIREVDFELPFGNTVFRHTRTYSQYPQFRIENYDARDGDPQHRLNDSGMFWDATGFGWMISHSPILLIDAAYAGWDYGMPFEDGSEQQKHVERCMFLPDAHRAIPFMSLKDGRYEAPPRFDAALGHDADVEDDFDPLHVDADDDDDEHDWNRLPTEWTVWLQNRSMKYTMKPVYDDIQGTGVTGFSIHDFPPVSGTQSCAYDIYRFGTPHYAVATEIDDEWGNRIEIDYCSFKQGHSSVGDGSSGCATCLQGCSAKGMIEQVRLIAGKDAPGESPVDRVAYRLVYVYRPGPVIRSHTGIANHSDFAQPMVHEVYVVPGDVPVPAGCRVMPEQPFIDLHDDYHNGESSELECLTALQALTWDSSLETEVSSQSEWLDKWVVRVRYLYADNNEVFLKVSQNMYDEGGLFHGCALRLIQASVTHREHPKTFDEYGEPLEPSERTEHTVYRYRWNSDGVMREVGELRAIYRNDTLERLRTASEVPTTTDVQSTWPLYAHLMLDEDVPELSEDPGEHSPDLLEWADQYFDAWDEVRVGSLWNGDNGHSPLGTVRVHGMSATELYASPFHKEMVDDYLKGVPNDPTGATSQKRKPVMLTDGVATHVDRAGEQKRAYRIHRFMMMSTDPSSSTAPPCIGAEGSNELCNDERDRYGLLWYHLRVHRAQLHEPYLQRIGDGSWNTEVYEPLPGDPHWIAVIDEYESVQAMLESAVIVGGGEEWRSIATLRGTTDEWLLPMTRRVVLMNPAGIVLSERTYDIRNGGSESEGMWEEFLYDWQFPSAYKMRKGDSGDLPLAIGRLLEHRTFGWSAAAIEADAANGGAGDPEDATAGLINIFEYEHLSTTASDELKNTLLPSRIGVKWGTAGDGSNPPYQTWLKQYIRDPKRPELVLHEIDYLTPGAGALPIEGVLDPAGLVGAMERADVRITTMAYLEDEWRGGGEAPTDFQPPIYAQMTIKPPAKASPDGDLLWPISVTYTDMHWGPDVEGEASTYRPGDKDTWTGVGAATEDVVESEELFTKNEHGQLRITFSEGVTEECPEFYASVERTLNNGQVIFKAVDVDLNEASSGELDIADAAHAAVLSTQITSESQELGGSFGRAKLRAPFAWTRESAASLPALEHWSYVGPYTTRPRFSIDHTGKQMRLFTRYVMPTTAEPQGHEEYFTVSNLYDTNPGSGGLITLQSFAPGTVVEEHGGIPTVSKTFDWWDEPNFNNLGADDYDAEYPVITVVQMGMDALGKPNGFTVEDKTGGGQSLEQKVTYGRFGEVSREKHHDGTIVRNVADDRGRLVRIYKGSQDDSTYWGGSGGADDMILVEKRTYGEGVLDANLPIEVRNYRLKPAAQYASASGASSLDTEGWATRTLYDWRGRPLVTRHYDDNGDITHQQVTFRDHADNVLLTATYGATLPWADDAIPTRLPGTLNVIPEPDDLLGDQNLIALESRSYNLPGQVEVVKTYNVELADEHSFTTSRTYYDFAGRVVWSQGEGGIVTKNIQDAKGRQIRTSTWHGDIELTRTETAYTDQDQPFRVKSYDRRHDASASPATLSDANAIITYRYTWYDHAGRVRATADVGTGDVGAMVNNDIEAGSSPFVWSPIDAVGWIGINDWDGSAVLTACDFPDGLPTTARISSFAYDDSGNQIVSVDPMGVVTRSRYNGFGQLVLQWENALRDLTSGTPDAASRLTATSYNGAEVARIGVLLDSTEIQLIWFDTAEEFDINEDVPWTGGEMLVSRVGSGAIVLNEEPDQDDGDPITSGGTSFSGSLTAWLDYPTTGALADPSSPSTPHDITYTYYADGLLATRTDERGVIFKYYYDHAGRLTELLADESDCTTYLHNDTPPKDRIDKITFTYDPAKGHLTNASAQDRDGGTTMVTVSSNEFAYDSRGNLTSESQYHAGAQVPTFDPTVFYEWAYAPDGATGVDNFDRLVSITYPIPVPDGVSTSNRILGFSYGAGNSITDAAGRIASVSSSGPAYHHLAGFMYTGAGRRVAFDRGGTTPSPAIRSSVFDNPIAAWDQGGTPTSGAYYGLSAFGETRALAYWREDGSSTEVLAAQRYAYDAAGRRTAVWHHHVPIAPPTGPPVGTNERSQLFGYDPLGRLTDAGMGELEGPLTDSQSGGPGITYSNLLPTAREVEWNLDARDVWTSRVQTDAAGTRTSAHLAGHRNELIGFVDPAELPSGSSLPEVEDRFSNDRSGNLILDEERFYEYDAWGRLVKVSERGTIALSTPPVGEEPEISGTPGLWLVHYTYDGLGRLIRKQTPIRDSTTGVQTRVRSERYYYDGARRIQETVGEFSPAVGSGGSGGTFADILILEELGTVRNELSTNLVMHDLRVDREYVYVPSAAGGYVDEFIGQFDRYGDPWWILQDANFNVLAMADEDGDVVRQVMYDPYGEPLFAEDFAAHPGLKIGHQGLFFDRLELPAPVSGSVSLGSATQLQPGVFGLYQTGNRVLLSRYGRWAQRDPNASGQLLRGLWHEGMSAMPGLTVGELASLVGDGHNLFAFGRNDPLNTTDPSGLFGFISAVMTGAEMFDTMTGVMDNAEMGLRHGFESVTGVIDYNEALLDAVAWALDPYASWDDMSYGPSSVSLSQTPSSSGLSMATRRGPRRDRPVRDLGLDNRKYHGDRLGHHDPAIAKAKSWSRKPGFKNVMFNQSLMNPHTKMPMRDKVGRLRPDVQAWEPKTKTLHVYERAHSQSKADVDAKKIRYEQWGARQKPPIKVEVHSNVYD